MRTVAATLSVFFLAAASQACRTAGSFRADYDDAVRQLRTGNLRETERLIERQRGIDDPARAAQLRYLKAELLLARGHAAEALTLLDGAVPADPESADARLRQLVLRGEALTRLGRYDAARQALDRANQLRGQAASDELKVLADMRSGALLTIVDQAEDGRKILVNAHAGAQRMRDEFLEASVLNQLAINRIRGFRYDEALTFADRAIELAEQSGARRVAAAALANTSICYSRLGDFERAHQNSEKSAAILERIGDEQSLQAGLGFRANVYMLEGDPARAVPLYRHALDIARKLHAESYTATWTTNLAQALAAVQDWSGAEQLNRRADAEKPQDEQARVSARLTAASIEAGRGNIRPAIAIYERVIEASPANPWQRWEAHAGLADAYVQTGKFTRASGEFERAIQMVETARSELVTRDHRLTFLSHLIRFYQAYVDLLMEKREFAKAFLIAERSRARIWAERVGNDDSIKRSPGIAEYAETSRRTGNRFLSYWVAPRRSFLWVIAPDGLHTFVTPGEQQLDTLVRTYQNSIQDLRNPLRTAAGKELYERLLSPARPWLPEGSRVILIPDGPLLNLNFETLPVTPERYWGEEATVSIAPSMAVALPRAELPVHAPNLLLVGAAETVRPEYPKLAQAMEEINSIQRAYPKAEKAVLTGAKANPSEFFAIQPERFSLIHFAAHGIANRSSPLDSAVVLSAKDGSYLLYARDILERKLTANVVTLAACRSAGAKSYPGEGLVGLVWAFLHAGCKNVVGTLWNVADRSTGEMMSVFYSQLAAGRPPAEALHRAKLSLIRGGTSWRHPFYWGAFQHYESGGTTTAQNLRARRSRRN